jgi:hypothetical protein
VSQKLFTHLWAPCTLDEVGALRGDRESGHLAGPDSAPENDLGKLIVRSTQRSDHDQLRNSRFANIAHCRHTVVSLRRQRSDRGDVARTAGGHPKCSECPNPLADEVDLSRSLRSRKIDGGRHRSYGVLGVPVIVRGSMTGKVEREDGNASSAQPGRKPAPTVEVATDTMDEDGPAVSGAKPLAAENYVARAGKLDRGGQGGVVRRRLAFHIVKCRSRC